MKSFKKTTFRKLYLIEPELYNRILPLLNEIDKNELIQLNQEHLEDEMGVEDETSANVDENKTESQTGVLQENQTMRSSISEPSSQHSSKEPLENSNHLKLGRSNKQKKPKKFLCQKCTKSFTTKFSLKRHNKTFHTVSNQEQQNIDNQEYDTGNTNINEMVNKTVSNKRMKRKLSDVDDDAIYPKRLKATRGVKRQQDDSLNTDVTDFKQPRIETSAMGLEDFSAPRGIKRQRNKAAYSEPRKKTRWIDFY